MKYISLGDRIVLSGLLVWIVDIPYIYINKPGTEHIIVGLFVVVVTLIGLGVVVNWMRRE